MAGKTKKKGAKATREARLTMSLLEQAEHTAHHKARDRRAEGKAAREAVPLASHGEFAPAAGRSDPVGLLQSQDNLRIASLVPIRFGRMSTSPFSFYRGAAIVMAEDLAESPTTGWLVQACGDAHVDNFGGFGTDQGSLVFDVNDFDETYPAPWEWDVKRLVASAVLAAREIGAGEASQRTAAAAGAVGYREAMQVLAEMDVMDRWTSSFSALALMKSAGVSKRKRDKVAQTALARTSSGAFPKLTTLIDGKRELKERPPLVVRITDQEELDTVKRGFEAYRNELRPDLQLLLGRYELVDFARKVVGVGSVGMPAYVGLFLSADGDPLFLQVKTAVHSVLEPHVSPANRFVEPGERVVVGQRLMQAAGDPLLGWVVGGEGGRHFYVRQLRDMKVSADLTRMGTKELNRYTEACGQVLAHAHARTGDPALIAGYLGKSPGFDEALASFAVAYANQTERDHAALQQAIAAGRVEAQTGI